MRRCIAAALIVVLACPALAQDAPPTFPDPGESAAGEAEKEKPEGKKLTPEKIAAAVRALSSRYVEERREARKKLIEAGEPAVRPLLEALEAESHLVRAAAAAILSRIGGETATGPLVKLLRDTRLAVRAQARQALARIGLPALKHLAGGLGEEGAITWEDFEHIAKRIIAAAGRDKKSRRELVNAGKPTVAPLVRMLKHESADVRAAAAEILGHIGGEAAAPALVKLLKDKDDGVKAATMEALARIGPSALKYLVENLGEEGGVDYQDFEPIVRQIVTTAVRSREARRELIRIGKPAVAPLIEALKNKSPNIRAAAAGILGFIGGETAAPALARLIKDKDESVKTAVREALARIGPAAVKYIAEVLKGGTDAERKEFELTISRMVTTIIVNLVGPNNGFGTYPGQFTDLEKLGRHAGPRLVKIARDADMPSSYRYLAVSAMGCLNDKSVMPALKEIFRKEAEFLRDEAALSLALLGDDSYIKEVVQEYQTKAKKGPNQYAYHSELALIYHKLRDWDKAEAQYKHAIKANPTYGLTHYNYACLLSVRGRTKEALSALKSALENNYRDGGWLMRDGELDNIRKLPEFQQLIKKHFPQTPGTE